VPGFSPAPILALRHAARDTIQSGRTSANARASIRFGSTRIYASALYTPRHDGSPRSNSTRNTDLRLEDFSVLENREPQQVLEVLSASSAPLVMCVLADSSGSERQNVSRNKNLEILSRFLATVITQSDNADRDIQRRFLPPDWNYPSWAVKPRRCGRGYKAGLDCCILVNSLGPQDLWADSPKVKPLRCPGAEVRRLWEEPCQAISQNQRDAVGILAIYGAEDVNCR